MVSFMYKTRGGARVERSLGGGLIALLILTIIFWPVKADVEPPANKPVVCACCAEEGEWYERSAKITDEQLHQLNRVRFSPTANTYQSPADDNELSIKYSLTQTRNGRRWELRFRDEQGKTGTLSFMLPATAIYYGADMQEKPPGGVGPALYKEWRIAGTARVTGVLKKGMAGATRFRLILQGRGNNCGEAEDYTNWILQVSSPRLSYSFYGLLNKPDI
jgi:hypothetical protein